MRKISLFFIITSVFPVFLSIALGSSGTRLLQEVVAPDQRLERLHGMPVLISDKQYTVILAPESIMLASKTTLYFNLVISNPGQASLAFSMDEIKAHSPQNKLTILTPEAVVTEKREFYSKEKYRISDEQEKMLAPFVEEKMEQLRKKLMKDQVIAPMDKSAGMIAVEVLFGTENFIIEVTTGDEHHKFQFNLGEF